MPTQGRLTLSQGVLSVTAPADTRVDAAVVGELAGFELIGLTNASVNVGIMASRHPGITLDLSTNPGTLMQIALAILGALGTPAFTQPEWLRIADVLASVHGGEELDGFAKRIRDAYEVTS